MTTLAFVLAAACGAVARVLVSQGANEADGYPYGTLIVNVVGSFALGVLANSASPTYTVVGVGFLGTLTTFSGLVRDAVVLGGLQRMKVAAGYVFTTLMLAIGCSALGYWIS